LLSPSGATSKGRLTRIMVTDDDETPISSSAASLLLLSFHHRDALAGLMTMAGWHVAAARRLEGIERRFVASDAIIAVIDARDAVSDGLSALTELADAVETSGAALVAIIDREDDAALERFVVGGATHVLAAPFSDFELLATLRLAERFAQRVAGQVHRAGGDSAPLLAPIARDSLTGLTDANAARVWLNQRLALKIRPISVLLVSVSRFEMINAAFGLETGDNLLRSMAHRIEPLVSEIAAGATLLARIAGAEFLIAIDAEISAERLQLLASALVERVERPFSTGADIVNVGCRIGVVQSGAEDGDATQLLRRASATLAEAKDMESGRIKLRVGSEAAVASLNASLSADLRKALMRGEIEILFQPQVAIPAGTITGVEALARWQHPVHGELGAVTLFSVAEQSDYLVELSAHVQRRAAEIAAKWPDMLASLRLSINVTAADVARPSFVDGFLAMIDKTGFPRERLTVEITESGLMEDLSAAAGILAALRAAGCRVAIDDFGTGYSSLAYLKALPLDYLKIDKGLSGDIEGSLRDSVVVRGVIDMARSLGLSVIAEGVETEDHLGLLAREGCNYYQGFLCAEPLGTAALATLVEGWDKRA
jgi:diguanylate cyclase (GGDEF)-like protein